MAMDRQEFLDLCPAYALGLLDGDDLARFRKALAAADTELLAAYRAAAHTAANLSLAAPEAELSPQVLARLMARIEAPASGSVGPQGARAATRPGPASGAPGPASSGPATRIAWLIPFRFAVGTAVALVLACLGLIAYVAALHQGLDRAQIAASAGRARIQALEDSLARSEAMLAVIKSAQMQMVALKGQDVDPVGYGKIIWDPVARKAILHVSNLPPEPADKDYQLWVIRDSKPVDAGVFQVKGSRPDGELYKIDNLVEADRSRISAFAVTLEPKGGLTQPSGKMYLLGSI